jgi:hypothetical protein
MKTTIDMAREAGFHVGDQFVAGASEAELKRFEALVRADEREKYKWDVHSCGPTCKRYACVAMREAVEAEREACAKVCEDDASTPEELICAAAIRTRGNT